MDTVNSRISQAQQEASSQASARYASLLEQEVLKFNAEKRALINEMSDERNSLEASLKAEIKEARLASKSDVKSAESAIERERERSRRDVNHNR